jgi:hypothetical protein
MWVWKYWNTHLLVQMNFMVWVSLMAGSDKSYPSWHLYRVWSTSSLHFLCWFKFWRLLSLRFLKILIQSCCDVLKQCLLWCSLSHYFYIALSTVVQAWRAIHFPWWELCHIEMMTDLWRMRKILLVTVGKHVSSFHWWWNPADVHEINSTTCVKTCHT